MVDKISVQIQLEGAAEIEQQLADVSKAGQQCFADIQKAAGQVGGFAKLDPSVIEQKFKQLGITAPAEIKKITAAVAQAGQLEGTVLGVANLEKGFNKLGRAGTAAFGLTRREIGALGRALSAIDLGPIGSQLALLGRVGGAFSAPGIAITAIGAGIALATKATIDFAEAIGKVSAEAIKLGLPIEQLDKLRRGLEGAGFGAKAVSAGIAQVKDELDTLDVQKLVDTLKGPSGGTAFRGSSIGGIPMGDLVKLKDAALGLGAAGELARKSLEQFGVVNFDPLTESFKKLNVVAGASIQEILRALEVMPDSVTRNNVALRVLGQVLGTEVIQALKAGGIEWDRFKQKMAEGGITAEQETAATRLAQAINRLAAEWARFGSISIAPQLTTAINAATVALELLGGALTRLDWSAFGLAARLALNPLVTLTQLLVSISWEPISGAGVAAWDALGGAIQGAIGWLLKFLGLQSQAGGTPLAGGAPIGGPGGGIGSAAAGGLLGGTGTGTSDSNLAWVSRGEYVTPARAVAQPGVLAFLEALRRSGGNLRGILDGMGRFALGGMVPRRMPAFAAGGMVGGTNLGTLTLGLPSGESVSVRATSGVVDRLRREAAMAQVRSGGRKPSRYS